MGEEQTTKVDSQTFAAKEKSSEKSFVIISEKKPLLQSEKDGNHDDSKDRDAEFARLELEKRLALIKAWEESEKTKADNKAYKKLSAVGAWENTKRASVEAELKQIEEDFERKKAAYAEKMKNKIAEIHKEAQEKRAIVEAKRGEHILKIEETSANFRATGNIPKKLFACFN
ncbi:hypothetical protein M9H77_32709 [Catharanthus roseus]|uniref:Uncharacterized protein n=1 Tax=Catharanthus roseus TaxID=4058 RepID=A0ACC0A4X7_CATRO|nr:hypothetical protein M9H77_32709 [Catharanthus roseus]